MRSVNKVQLIGRVGQDPEVNTTGGGDKVANLSLATNPSWNEDKTEWHRLVCWRKLAEIVEEYVSKGDAIYVEGRLTYSEWEDQKGQSRKTAEVNVDQLVMLGGGGRPSSSSSGGDSGGTEVSDDDLPF